MLQYEKIDVSERIDVNKTNALKEYMLCGTSLRFWENKGWIIEIDPYGWFQWYLDTD